MKHEKRRGPGKRLKRWYRRQRYALLLPLALRLGRDLVRSDDPLEPEFYRWWSRSKGVLACVGAVAIHILSWRLDLQIDGSEWVPRSGAVLALAAAYLEILTMNADDKLSISRRLERSEVPGTPSNADLEGNQLHWSLTRLARDSRADYLNAEYLRRRRLNTSRWALLLGGYGTATWAYGDLAVQFVGRLS